MECMSDPTLRRGELPPIPEGCGILPVAENRIARGPHPERLDLPPEGFVPLTSPGSPDPPVLNDAMEQIYRRILARALALSACALLLASAVAFSLVSTPPAFPSLLAGPLAVRIVLGFQLVFLAFCSRYVENLSIGPAGILLFSYAAFTALEFSVLLHPATLAVAFLCAALMYAATAVWGFVRRTDLARPITAIFMMLAGIVILVAVNHLLHTPPAAWTLSSLAVAVFAALAGYYAEPIRDLYQEFDDDNAEGWKASVLGALMLVVNSINVYLLIGAFLRSQQDGDPTDRLAS